MARQPKHSRKSSPYTIYQALYAFQPEIKRRAINLAQSILVHALKAGKLRIVHTGGGDRDPSIFLPRMDIMDDPNSRKVVAVFELPGVRSDELTVSVHDGVMHLNGKRSARTPQEYGIRPTFQDDSTEQNGAPVNETQYKTQELRYGLFKREVVLPEGVKEKDVTATLKDGLLIVTWPLPADPASGTVPKTEPSAAESALAM
ncbi:HSP20-like chaperone [Amanita muscaria]